MQSLIWQIFIKWQLCTWILSETSFLYWNKTTGGENCYSRNVLSSELMKGRKEGAERRERGKEAGRGKRRQRGGEERKGNKERKYYITFPQCGKIYKAPFLKYALAPHFAPILLKSPTFKPCYSHFSTRLLSTAPNLVSMFSLLASLHPFSTKQLKLSFRVKVRSFYFPVESLQRPSGVPLQRCVWQLAAPCSWEPCSSHGRLWSLLEQTDLVPASGTSHLLFTVSETSFPPIFWKLTPFH